MAKQGGLIHFMTKIFDKTIMQLQKTLFICICLSGCSDYAIYWEDKPYEVIAIDTYYNATLAYEIGGGDGIDRVDARVVAVGSNADYVVAKRCDLVEPTSCSYYYIDRKMDSIDKYREAVSGPFTLEGFNKKSQLLGLPVLKKL